MTLPKFKIGIVSKLASIAVHAEELFSSDGHAFDRAALTSLFADSEVREFLAHPAMQVFLPRKRSA